MVEFAAYRSSDISTTWVDKDRQSGILGTAVSVGSPVLTGESLELLAKQATDFVAREPKDSLYLIDDQKRIRKIVINEKYHAAKERRSQRITIAVFVAILFVTGLAIGPTSVGVPVTACVTALYVTAIRKGFMNEIEAGIGCETLLVLALSVISIFIRMLGRG
jgi:hypothetical protein